MRTLLVGIVAAVAVVAVLLSVGPQFGGPTVRSMVDRPTRKECEQLAAIQGGRRPSSVSVRFIWSSDGSGWGCSYRYPDGSGGTAQLRPR
jgi:hypothetical protein